MKDNNGWVKVSERLPTKEDADENGKVLLYRQTNEGQRSLEKTIYDWDMVKYSDDKAYWQPLPQKPTTI